jgi:hypothetical protein
MKLNSAISKFLTNKLVLHIVAFLALFNVIGHMMIGHYNIVVYVILIALLIRYFSKNMIVVLGAPLILVNLLSLNYGSYMEGLETQTDGEEKKDEKKDEDKDATGEKKIAPSNDKESKKNGDETTEESFEVGRAKKSGHSIDYATTIEDAYDQLNSILGKDGIKNLTADTERLMQQQAQLAGSLKDMGPLIEKMGPMMESVQGMMKDMPDVAKGDVMGKVEQMLAGLKK